MFSGLGLGHSMCQGLFPVRIVKVTTAAWRREGKGIQLRAKLSWLVPVRLQSTVPALLATGIYMACISRTVNETSHHQGQESNTLRKGIQAKDILPYYLIIPPHSLSIRLCSLCSFSHMIMGSVGAETIF